MAYSVPTPDRALPADPFPAPEHFGGLAFLQEHDPHSFVASMTLSALAFLLFAWRGYVSETTSAKPTKPLVAVEQIIRDEPTSPGLPPAASSPGATAYQEVLPEVRVSDGKIGPLDTTDDTGDVQVRPQGTPIAPGAAARVRGLHDQAARIKVEFDERVSLAGAFAVPDEYDSVVYVIDKSGSMSGHPVERVKAELVHALEQLADGKRFSVVFFDDTTWPLYAQRGGAAAGVQLQLLTADASSKKPVIRWINQMFGDGGTIPEPAVMLALSQDPAYVVLLSDGEFCPSYVRKITDMNQAKGARKAVITCVGLSEAVQTLRDIARNNQGVYYQATL